MSEEVKKQRANVDKEYAETVCGSGTDIYQQRRKYSEKEALERVSACYCFGCSLSVSISLGKLGIMTKRFMTFLIFVEHFVKAMGRNFITQENHLMSFYVHLQILFSLKNILVMGLDLHN